jgi:hypothetical protein
LPKYVLEYLNRQIRTSRSSVFLNRMKHRSGTRIVEKLFRVKIAEAPIGNRHDAISKVDLSYINSVLITRVKLSPYVLK